VNDVPDRHGARWPEYLRAFHHQHPGITEDVLSHAVDGGTTPYEWVAEPVHDGPVLDLACGSGPLALALAAPGWIGMDMSEAELTVARGRGGTGVALADAGALPLEGRSAASVVCSMALMVVQPLDEVLSEVARVLRPGGVFVSLVPSGGPLTVADATRYALLLVALRRRRLEHPNDLQLADVGPHLARHGLRLVDDRRRRFTCQITSPSVAVMCVRSLYLPDIAPRRLASGERLARRWVGKKLGLPLRRLVAVRGGVERCV